jgi:hypothetical protein
MYVNASLRMRPNTGGSTGFCVGLLRGGAEHARILSETIHCIVNCFSIYFLIGFFD